MASYKGVAFDRCILHSDFCRQLLRIGVPGKTKIVITGSDVMAITPSGPVLFSRLIESDRPVDFREIFKHHVPRDWRKQVVQIPTKLQLILERAIAMVDLPLAPVPTRITIEGARARFFSGSDRGEVRDVLRLEDKHPDTELWVDPKLIRRGYGIFDKMLLTESCAIMSKGSRHLYLVSVTDH
jgi:hypothetical protein